MDKKDVENCKESLPCFIKMAMPEYKIQPYLLEFMELLDTSMKYYISLFLIIRFNPFSKSNFTNFDRKVVFSAGIFLITTTALGQYAKKIHFMEESMKFLRVIR